MDGLVAGPQLCLHCAESFEATPFFPPSPYVPPLALAEAGPAGATPCAVHAGNAAVGNCARCGLFVCALCATEVEGQSLCAACFDRLAAARELPALRTSFVDLRGLALASGVLGLFLSFFGLLIGPLTLTFATLAVRQRRRGEAAGGWLGILLAVGLGIAQIGFGLFLVVSLIRGFKR
jgi:hypothetical protein